MNRRSVRSCCIYVLAAIGCQGKSAPPPAPALPPGVVVRDSKGEVLVEMHPGHPCRATIGPFEMMVGGPPLVAQLGDAHWVGDDESNGTTLSRNSAPVARIFPVGDPTTASVLDPQGVPLVRVQKGGGDVLVSNAQGQTVRHLHTRTDGAIVIDQPAATATGTNDLVLVALLTASELAPEVRMIAACQRVLVKGP
jgi:DNA-binding beta-propeller fold protein YncE